MAKELAENSQKRAESKQSDSNSPAAKTSSDLSPEAIPESLSLKRALGNQAMQADTMPPFIQPKLKIGAPNDRYEQEADRIADQVMRMSNADVTQRVETGRAQPMQIQRRESASQGLEASSPESRVISLKGGGQQLDPATRSFFEPRFGYDFSNVRVHTDSSSAASAKAVNAFAYTVERDIVFDIGCYQPSTAKGRRLLAHELAHVRQQSRMGPWLQRQVADPWATADATRNILLHPSTPPARVRSDTLAYLQGGLIHDSQLRPRVSAIIGPGATIQGIAQTIRPHFVAAANSGGPNGQPGPAAPTEDELARALMVYSRFFLPVPAMTRFVDGLRLPLPIEIDVANGEWIVNSNLVRLWAQSFDPTWQPLLSQRPGHLAQPDPAALAQEVRNFLTQNNDTLSRGIALWARVMRNPSEAVFFFFEVFKILGAQAFDVALAFMDNAVNHQMQLLAGLTAGNAILRRLQMVLATPPAVVSASQQNDLQRANRMLRSAMGQGAGQIAPTPRELPETAQQLANRPGGVGRWQQVAAQDPAGGRHRMVLGRDVLAGVIARSVIGGITYRGPAYGGRISPAQFIQNNAALLNPTNDPVLAARLALVSAISVNEGFLDAIRLRDRGVVSAGLQQSSAHVEIELPALMHRFKTASPDLFMLYFGIYGLDVVPHGVDHHNNPRFRFVQVRPNGTRVPLATWRQILTFFGGAGGGGAYRFLTKWAARFREAAVASPEFSVAQLLEAASRLDRILREVPTLNVPTVGPVALNTLVNSEFGVALILDSHINQPGRVRRDLQRATTAAGHHANANAQEQAIMNRYEPIRHTHNTPVRNANLNRQGLNHAHGSFTGW